MLKRKVRRTNSACREGTVAAAGTLRVGDFLRMGQKQGGKCWEGVIGRSESGLE